MEKIEYKHNALLKSKNAFERALELYKNPRGKSQAEIEAYTASVIKHFELFYEMIWKFFKFYLFKQYGTQTTGSKTVFRACYDQKIGY